MKIEIGDKVVRNPDSQVWLKKRLIQPAMFAIIGTVIDFSYSFTRDFDEIRYARVRWDDGQIFTYEVDSDELVISEDPSSILKDIL